MTILFTPDHQTEILAIVDPDFTDLADEYLADQIETLSQTEALIQAKDFSTIQNTGHKLRSNAVIFGLSWLGDLGHLLELAAESRNAEETFRLSQQMLQSLRRVRFVSKNT